MTTITRPAQTAKTIRLIHSRLRTYRPPHGHHGFFYRRLSLPFFRRPLTSGCVARSHTPRFPPCQLVERGAIVLCASLCVSARLAQRCQLLRSWSTRRCVRCNRTCRNRRELQVAQRQQVIVLHRRTDDVLQQRLSCASGGTLRVGMLDAPEVVVATVDISGDRFSF